MMDLINYFLLYSYSEYILYSFLSFHPNGSYSHHYPILYSISSSFLFTICYCSIINQSVCLWFWSIHIICLYLFLSLYFYLLFLNSVSIVYPLSTIIIKSYNSYPFYEFLKYHFISIYSVYQIIPLS